MDGSEKHNPEWQTLSQRLSSIVHNREHPIGEAFAVFCETLQLSYRKILRSVENVGYGSTRFMTSFDDFYVISEQDLGFNKVYLEDQRNLILGHLYQMTEQLVEFFNNTSYMFIRKVRLCYEKCFFNRVGHDLILVYRIVYGKSMQMLEKRIARLKEVEICKLGLQMRDEWWLDLFNPDMPILYGTDDDEDSTLDYTDRKNEFGDDEDLTDYDEDEYCTDTEHADVQLFFAQKDSVDAIKKSLQLSKSKVLSRSFDHSLSDINITSAELIDIHSKQMQAAITERVDEDPPRFDSDAMARFLQDDLKIGKISTKGCGYLKKCNSTSSIYVIKNTPLKPLLPKTNTCQNESDSFDTHFGQALASIKNIFTNSSPLKKMQCLTAALRLIACKVEELRLRGKDAATVDRSKISVTAEDLLPLLVLVLLKMSPHDVAKLYVELLFVADLMADFLSSGCHSYALCEFQIAYRVLDQTCDELSI